MSANSPNDTTPAREPGTTNTAETPAEKLAKLKSSLEQAQSDYTLLDKKLDNLKNTIAELTKAVAELTKAVTEIDQKTKAWEKAAQSLDKKKQEEEIYHKNKKTMLEATVPNKEFVKTKMEEGDKEVKELKLTVESIRKEEAARTQEYAAAKAATEAKQQRYDAVIKLAQTNEVWLKDLAALHAEAEKEDEKNNVSRMYFLILEMEKVLGKLDIPNVQEFEHRVNEAQSAVSNATVAEQAAKDRLTQKQDELKKAEKNLSDAKNNRRKNILSSIPENNAAPAPS